MNVVAAHCMVMGASLGAASSAQTYMDYGRCGRVPRTHYVALGHLHRTQPIAGAAPIWLGLATQVDFGEWKVRAACCS